jgi:hypothetical protein
MQQVVELRDRCALTLEQLSKGPKTDYVDGSVKSIDAIIRQLNCILGTEPPDQAERVRRAIEKHLRGSELDSEEMRGQFDKTLNEITAAVLKVVVLS